MVSRQTWISSCFRGFELGAARGNVTEQSGSSLLSEATRVPSDKPGNPPTWGVGFIHGHHACYSQTRMQSWMLVRFSMGEVAAGVVARLMRDLMPLALEVRRPEEVGVFSLDLGSEGKCVYFSPGAAKAFASALAKLPAERCDSPNPEALLLLYGGRECLPPPAKRLDAGESPRILRVEELIE